MRWRFVHDRAVDAYQSAVPVEGKQQRRDVAEADDEFRVAPDSFEVESISNAVGALASARGKDGADFRVVERCVQVGKTVVVRAGQKGQLVEGVLAEIDAKPPVLEDLR